MIVFSENCEGVKTFTTNGCGCCSVTLTLPEDREEIIKELQQQADELKASCKLLKMDISEFIK